MKRIFLICNAFLMGCIFELYSQNITITDDDSYTANPSAMLDVKSTSKGLLIPRLTTAQRTTLGPTAATGLLVYDTNLNSFMYWNGSAWTNLTSGNASGVWGYNSPYVYLNNTNDRVGVGTQTPYGKMEVKADASIGTNDPIFHVVNNTGDTIFAVYNEGVRIYVQDDPAKASGSKGGFAVGGFTPSKGGLTNEYLRITPDSVRIFIEEGEVAKASGSKGGFAVGGFTPSKALPDNYFNIYGSTSATVVDPSEARIMWYPLKEAFLAGRIIVEKPDSVGLNSFSTGYLSRAKGSYSQAFGYNAIARGNYSTAIGKNAIANSENSFAFGDSAYVGNMDAYAFGKRSQATGSGSYALGYLAQSSAQDAFAIGVGTEASGLGSFAIGFIGRDSSDVTTENTKATAPWSVAIGMGAQATNNGAFAIGTQSLAQSNYSLAIGYKANSTNWYSTAIGYNTIASGFASTAMGHKTVASGDASTAIGANNIASGYASTAMGILTEANNNFSTAMGNRTTASGEYSTAMGDQSVASGRGSTAMGYFSNAGGYYSTSLGYGTLASGDYSVSMGQYTSATGVSTSTFGYSSNAGGNYSAAFGVGTFSQPYASFTVGRYNIFSGTADSWIETDPLFVIGNGADEVYRWNAMTVLKNGNVGIGTATPTEKIEIGVPTGTNSKIFLNGGASNMLMFNNNGMGIPSFTNRSDGTKIIVNPSIDASNVDYALGYTTSTLWYSVAQAASAFSHRFYAGTSELVRICGDGNVGIGATAPTRKLEVNGNMRLGTNGTTIANVIKATVNKDIPSLTAGSSSIQTFSVPNAAITSTVYISPAADINDGIVICYARVSASGTVSAKFKNTSAGTIDVAAMNYYITVIE